MEPGLGQAPPFRQQAGGRGVTRVLDAPVYVRQQLGCECSLRPRMTHYALSPPSIKTSGDIAAPSAEMP